jgi:hypothetical protein
MKYKVSYKIKNNLSKNEFENEFEIIETDFKILNKLDLEKLYHILIQNKSKYCEIVILGYEEL